MLPNRVESEINKQRLKDDFIALGTFMIPGSNLTEISHSQYRDRVIRILELMTPEFLELYLDAQGKIKFEKLKNIVFCTLGFDLLITLLLSGEINLIPLVAGFITSLSVGVPASRLIPNSKLKIELDSFRTKLLIAGGPDMSRMDSIIRVGINSKVEK